MSRYWDLNEEWLAQEMEEPGRFETADAPQSPQIGRRDTAQLPLVSEATEAHWDAVLKTRCLICMEKWERHSDRRCGR